MEFLKPLIIDNIDADVEFVFNSNDDICFKKRKKLEYLKTSSGKKFSFELDIPGKVIKAHPLPGKICFEFIEGLYVTEKQAVMALLAGECVSTRGYANSVNYKNSVSAVNDNGAYVFRL